MATESEVLAVTNSSGTASFSANCYYVEIYNSGSKTAYINFGSAATTNHFPIGPGETLKIAANIADVRGITAGSDTTTFQIIGTR